MQRRQFLVGGLASLGGALGARAIQRTPGPEMAWSGWLHFPNEVSFIGHWMGELPNRLYAVSTTRGVVAVYRPFELINLCVKRGWFDVTPATPEPMKEAIRARARRQLAAFLQEWRSGFDPGEYERAEAGADWSRCVEPRRPTG